MHEALAGAAEWQNAIAGDPLNKKGRLILLRTILDAEAIRPTPGFTGRDGPWGRPLRRRNGAHERAKPNDAPRGLA